jgi:nucleoside-diphosphate-sugar epimerase
VAAPSALVTGAAGFIGRATVTRLRADGSNVVGTDLRDHPSAEGLVLGDLCDPQFVSALLRNHSPETVIHLAGMLPSAARRDPLSATRANIDASCALIERACDAGVRRFVFGSSLGVYGGRFDTQPVSEETPAAPQEIYGAGKLYVEYVGGLLSTEQFAFSALRIATVLGEGVTNSASPWRSQVLEALRSDSQVVVPVPFVASAILPMVHVEDVARALSGMALAKSPVFGVFNSPVESMEIAELGALVSELNPKARIEAGTRSETGIPAYLTDRKLSKLLGFERTPLRRHFENARGVATSSRRS